MITSLWSRKSIFNNSEITLKTVNGPIFEWIQLYLEWIPPYFGSGLQLYLEWIPPYFGVDAAPK